MKEIWKDIPGYEGMYQVSTLGNVRALQRCVIPKKGKHAGVEYVHHARMMSLSATGPGFKKDNHYLSVMLSKNGHAKRVLVHILVADAFIPNPDKLPQINHINGIKHDNRLENLERCSREENMRHAAHILKATKNLPPIPIMCIETQQAYRSLSEAQRETGIERHALKKAIQGGTGVKGFHWKAIS